MIVAGLFAGIGGLELGLTAAGHRTALLCEIDAAAAAVLQRQFPQAPIHGDVTSMRRLPSDVQVVSAGFPCQDLSLAGPKTGLKGARSSLVANAIRLAASPRVQWLVLENVPFLRHLASGAAMAELLRRLEDAGFAWAYRTVDTQFFGLPQRRQRILFVASRDHDPARVLFADAGKEIAREALRLDRPIGFYWTEGRSGAGLVADGVPTIKAGSSVGIPSPPAVLLPSGMVVLPTIETAERLQGFTSGWTELGAPLQRRRWALVGNAVSVPVASWLGERLLAPGDQATDAGHYVSPDKGWPSAAMGGPGRRPVAVNASMAPRGLAPSRLSEAQGLTWRPISRRALAGFVGRAAEGRLRFPEGFIDRLRHALVELPE